jgi:palmitoyltransferase
MSPILFTIVYLICIVMCLAVGTMLAWQLWSVSIGETAVEGYDHEHYRKIATSRGEVCLEFSYFPSLSENLADLPKFL